MPNKKARRNNNRKEKKPPPPPKYFTACDKAAANISKQFAIGQPPSTESQTLTITAYPGMYIEIKQVYVAGYTRYRTPVHHLRRKRIAIKDPEEQREYMKNTKTW
jgi:hypothetical protein